MIQLSPLVRFVGSPIFSIYLRLLGAKIGRGVVILSPTVPACPDMLTVGAGTVIRKDVVITGYRARGRRDPDRPGLARPATSSSAR